MQGNHIKLTFYQVGEASSGYCLFRLIESENVLTFSENRSLTRIDILARIIIRGDYSARKCDNSTRYIIERKHDAIAKEIVASSILRLAENPDIRQELKVIPLFGKLTHGNVTRRSVSYTKFGKHLVAAAISAASQKTFCLRQVALVELSRSINGYTARFQ